MTTTAPTIIRLGSRHARVTPWRGRPGTARLVVASAGSDVPSGFLSHCLSRLRADGFRSVLTGALTETEQGPFLRAGFRVHEHLLLLSRDLAAIPPPGAARLRAGRARDRSSVLALDTSAFPPLWQLDDLTLAEALEATPQARFRVAATDGDGETINGYAITGRAGRRGYLQRLAVAPTARRSGIGRALVVDGLRWLRRWRAAQVLVNTQVDNHAALALYRSLGFEVERGGLSVLAADLD